MSDKIETMKCQSCFAALESNRATNGIIVCKYCRTPNVLPAEMRKVIAVNSHEFTMRLINALVAGYNMDSLELMVVDLSTKLVQKTGSRNRLDWEDLGSGKRIKCMDLVGWCQRRGYLQDLVDVAIAHNERLDI